jgi:hypothetical protein
VLLLTIKQSRLAQPNLYRQALPAGQSSRVVGLQRLAQNAVTL